MRRRFVQMANGELVEYGDHIPERVAPDVLRDIKPYQSMVDGTWITSRSQHRTHLKDHGCVEIGNDSALARKPQGIPDVAPQQRKELYRAQVNDMTHEQLKRAIERDVNNWKWNSRER